MRKMALMLALIGTLVACGDAFSPSGVAGSYALTSANGESLPFTLSSGGESRTFESGALTLNEESTYLLSVTWIFDDGTTAITVTLTGLGTYALVEPSMIRLTATIDGDVTSGTIDGTRITIILDPAVSLVFER